MFLKEDDLVVLEKYFTIDEIISLRNNENLYEKSSILIERLFAGVTDKGGAPYIDHLYYVAKHLLPYGEKAAAAGLLHDTLEDIEEMNAEILSFLRIPNDVIEMVLLVTKLPDIAYEDYITGIINSDNFNVKILKFIDISHNFDSARLAKLNPVVRERLENKYRPQLRRLKKALEIGEGVR